jgi:predicted RecB family endonuclease
MTTQRSQEAEETRLGQKVAQQRSKAGAGSKADPTLRRLRKRLKRIQRRRRNLDARKRQARGKAAEGAATAEGSPTA